MEGEGTAEPALTGASMAVASGFDIALAEAVVLVYEDSLVPRRAKRGRFRRGSHPFRSVGRLAATVDIVVAAGPGAPVAAVTVEFLAAFGVRRLISVGRAGLLNTQTDARIHVVDRAVSDEGTSCHYGGNPTAHEGLTAAVLAEVGGSPSATLTTDVPFRHTPNRLRAHRSAAHLVEMECAAVFSAARMFDIEATAILVVSDVFGEHEWTRSEQGNTELALRDAITLATGVLTRPS